MVPHVEMVASTTKESLASQDALRGMLSDAGSIEKRDVMLQPLERRMPLKRSPATAHEADSRLLHVVKGALPTRPWTLLRWCRSSWTAT